MGRLRKDYGGPCLPVYMVDHIGKRSEMSRKQEGGHPQTKNYSSPYFVFIMQYELIYGADSLMDFLSYLTDYQIKKLSFEIVPEVSSQHKFSSILINNTFFLHSQK